MSRIEISAFDPHVHDRGLNQSHIATTASESEAALAGGYFGYLAMPNTNPPLTDEFWLDKKLNEAESETHVVYGAFLAGVDGNQKEVAQASNKSCGLKIYMNNTTGQLLVDKNEELEKHFYYWKGDKPICVHAEGPKLATAIELSRKFGKRLHVCHVATKAEILMIKEAKERRLSVTCEVTPHHLFLTQDDLSHLGAYGLMKPALASKKDQEALWEHINNGVIDCIASDHAPHTKEDKESGNPPFGVPGLETTLPLMLQAVNDGRLTMERLRELVEINPQKIFSIPFLDKNGTYAVIDITDSYYADSMALKTACGWTPFTGHKVMGKVLEVNIMGEKVYKDGEVLGRFKQYPSLMLYRNNNNGR